MARAPKAMIYARAWTSRDGLLHALNRGFDTKIEYGDGTRRYDHHKTIQQAQAHARDLIATRHIELDQIARVAQNHTTIKPKPRLKPRSKLYGASS